MILTKEEAQKLLKKALSFSKADECEVSVNGGITGNIRYALNAVSTAGEVDSLSISVTKAPVRAPMILVTRPLSA